jgi:diacylglycerol kinase family enzyme
MAANLRTFAAARIHRVRRPTSAVLLCNPWSGGGKVEKFGLVELATSLGVETVMLDDGLDLAELAREAIARGADCLGMAGGDGSQALVASIAVEHDLPFVCVAAGTRNHFALDLGLNRADPRHSVYAFRDAIERRVDYATVNGRFFVNNVSLGVYATIVQQEGYREAKAATTRRLLPELLGETAEPFDLSFVTPDGADVDGSFLVMVSNDPYVLAASPSTSQRLRLDTGRLGVFAVTAATGTQAAEVVTLALAGQGGRSGHAFEFSCETFEIRSRSGTAYAGVDGEALTLDTPMTFRSHPEGLRMLVPEGNIEIALRRQSRGVHVRDLVHLASGASPG